MALPNEAVVEADSDWIVCCPCGLDLEVTRKEADNILAGKSWWYASCILSFSTLRPACIGCSLMSDLLRNFQKKLEKNPCPENCKSKGKNKSDNCHGWAAGRA